MNGPVVNMNPYIAFPGHCREAIEFYKNAFNGEVAMMTFKDSPTEVPDDYKDKILHTTLKFGDALIMASDAMPGQEVVTGSAYSLSINAPTIEEAEKIFNTLSNEGRIVMEMQDTFWGARFGMCSDKFGLSWMVNCELPKSE
jgi:PhnB protein